MADGRRRWKEVWGAQQLGNNFNYFSENKLSKLANFMQFKRMLMFCLKNWGSLGPLGRPCLRHLPTRFQFFIGFSIC